MASIERTPILEGKAEPARAPGARAEGWKPSAIAADIATMGTGTLLAGLFNIALVFVVARMLGVEDYGYWRMFVLYAGYVGFFHLGFADGALLRWAGRRLEEFHQEIGPAMRFLWRQHILLLAPLGLLASVILPPRLRFIALAVAGFALIMNTATLLQFALQGARIFRPVAISTVAAPGLFFTFVLLWRWRGNLNWQEVVALYGLAWMFVVVFLGTWAKPWSKSPGGAKVKGLGMNCVASGWPMVMANTGASLTLAADRLSVSWAATIQNFAQYSLAGSAIAVPVMAIQASSKVLFSHLAARTAQDRSRIYGVSSLALLLAWAALLPYYFLLGIFLRHFLPKYLPSLEYARVLLLGIPFIAVVQILQMSFAYLSGRQRPFLWRTAGVLAVSLGLTSLAAFGFGSLKLVACVQVAVLGCWWLWNERALRGLTGATVGDWARFLGIYGMAWGGYWVTTARTAQFAAGSIVLYYAGLGAFVLLLWRTAPRAWFRGVFAKEGAAE